MLLVVDVSGSMGDGVSGTGKNKMDLAKQAAVASLPQFSDAEPVVRETVDTLRRLAGRASATGKALARVNASSVATEKARLRKARPAAPSASERGAVPAGTGYSWS